MNLKCIDNIFLRIKNVTFFALTVFLINSHSYIRTLFYGKIKIKKDRKNEWKNKIESKIKIKERENEIKIKERN